MLAYGRDLEAEGSAQVGGSFTGDPAADELIETEPNAFLLGVLFTQGVPAERAWSAPYLLQARLGHLNVKRMAEEREAVRRAVLQPPMLHRFKNTLPRWISSAARRLVDQYDADASNIWTPESHVVAVIERLTEFDGIGRKKAVMATEILVRHFGARLEGRERGQVAYDVHVRRVFLRSGLAERDTLPDIETAAAAVCPDAPGTLDLAAWLIGRETCRPRAPQCGACRLGDACLRRTWIAVEGVGPKRRTG